MGVWSPDFGLGTFSVVLAPATSGALTSPCVSVVFSTADPAIKDADCKSKLKFILYSLEVLFIRLPYC